ncbi:hypothetical protein SRHO_G00236950 [Serrasalmus rhombeus]
MTITCYFMLLLTSHTLVFPLTGHFIRSPYLAFPLTGHFIRNTYLITPLFRCKLTDCSPSVAAVCPLHHLSFSDQRTTADRIIFGWWAIHVTSRHVSLLSHPYGQKPPMKDYRMANANFVSTDELQSLNCTPAREGFLIKWPVLYLIDLSLYLQFTRS